MKDLTFSQLSLKDLSKYIPKRLLGSTLFKHNLLTFSYLCFVRLSPVRYTLDMNCAGDQIVNRNTNCLVYCYWYEPEFYNWLPVFLKKSTGCIKLPVRIKNPFFVAGTFLAFIFLLPCDILVTCLCPICRVLV